MTARLAFHRQPNVEQKIDARIRPMKRAARGFRTCIAQPSTVRVRPKILAPAIDCALRAGSFFGSVSSFSALPSADEVSSRSPASMRSTTSRPLILYCLIATTTSPTIFSLSIRTRFFGRRRIPPAASRKIPSPSAIPSCPSLFWPLAPPWTRSLAARQTGIRSRPFISTSWPTSRSSSSE